MEEPSSSSGFRMRSSSSSSIFAASLALAAATLAPPAACAFTSNSASSLASTSSLRPVRRPGGFGRPHDRSQVVGAELFSTVDDLQPSETRKNNGKSSEREALSALEKLLERQRREMRETETLIERLSSSSSDGSDDVGDVDEYVDEDFADFTSRMNAADDVTKLKAAGFGASILAGVDYGFVSRSEGAKFDDLKGGTMSADDDDDGFVGYGPPANLFALGSQQFWRNLDAMKGEYKDEVDVNLTPKQRELHAKLQQLTLNSTAIWERERSRGPLTAPLIIKVPYLVLCTLLDVVFEGRYPPARFFLLETVARMPYFSYITMLHLYETLGFWRRSADIKRVHFAEEWNEYHHLLIMESLGGDQRWWVRFMAQHSAITYYVVLCLLWAISPSLSYKFSEMLETHAVDTYGQFVDENEELLKELPPSLAAVEYYSFGASDPFFGEYQTSAVSRGVEIRKPGQDMKSLYDVFSAIRADEGDHVGTMKACLDPNIAVNSPSMERTILTGVALAAAASYVLGTGDLSEVDGVGDMVDSMRGLLEGSTDDATASAVNSFFDSIFGTGGTDAAAAAAAGVAANQAATGEEGAEGAVDGLLANLDFLSDMGINVLDDAEFLSSVKVYLIDLIEFLSRLF